MHPKLKLS